ncbi:hypothetical protein HYT92_02915 [Candidatus Pacearchaeota archaeon]|nr:hypothetical protein [Candidatus Pacearchaeota archaeon]
MAENSANASDSGILKGIKSRILSYSLPLLVLGSLGGCVTSGIKPINSYKTEITEPEIVSAYNQDAEIHLKNKEYTSAWDNYAITRNIRGLETILEEYYKDTIAYDKIKVYSINKELKEMCVELRKENSQLKEFEDKVVRQARIYEDKNNPKSSLERAAILYEIICRHDDAERCLILWINEDEGTRYDTKKIMDYYKRFSKDADFSSFMNEALKKAEHCAGIMPPVLDDCESAWIIGEALDSMEIRKKAVKAGILCGSMSEAWNKRAFEVQEEINQGKQQALKD